MRSRTASWTVGVILCLLVVFGLTATSVAAKDADYDAVVHHLRARYQAKKQRIPFLGLARFAVKLVKPAGGKSFNITIFENLKFKNPNRGLELRSNLPGLLSPDWVPAVRFSSVNWIHSYVYARDFGNSAKLIILNIEGDQATVIRAKIDPEKLIEFLQNPRILGIPIAF